MMCHSRYKSSFMNIARQPFFYSFRKAITNNIINIENCLCADKNVNNFLQNTEFSKRPKGRIHIFGSDKIISDEKIKIETNNQNDRNSGIKLKGKGKIKKVKENQYFSGTILSPENQITVKLNNKNITFDVRGFFQSNLTVFEKVLTLICNTLPEGNSVLDMYSGCGSISAFLADKFKHVTLVEHNRDAIVFAEQNMAGTNHKSFGLSGASWVKTCAPSLPPFDACVVDPPRSGMEKEVLEYLCNSKIPFIRSLSCDPVTHARDAEKLIKAGYKLEKLYLLDFYPHTSHIESLAIFNLEI